MAPRTTKCLSLVKGRRIRLTRLDGCGRPVYGDSSTAVSKGFISVAFSANTTDTDEVKVTNAAGEVCVFEPAETTLSGYAIEITFCEVDPDLFSLVTGQPVIVDSFGNVVGLDIDTATSLTGSGFALELWAGTAAGDACAVGSSAQGSYGYLLVPFLRGGIVGEFTVENGAVTFTLTGAQTKDGNLWGFGPYADIQIGINNLPGKMLTSIGKTVALRTLLVDVNPPLAHCGTRPLLDSAAPALTAITRVITARSVAFSSTPTNIATPVWYEFGDGTWDYVSAAAGGSATHVYAAAGTYIASASSNGVWRSVSVTVV